MLINFFEKLTNRVATSNSLLCIGLDPHVGQLQVPTADAAQQFCTRIIQQTHPYAAAYKPNSAFFEAFGPAGFEALKNVLAAIPEDIPVILDNKRGDIDTTAQAYASSSYDIFNAGAVTLSPYMGWDSVQPFVTGQYSDRGAFVLCKTSNPSSRDLQELKLNSGHLLYEQVAQVCNKWNDGRDDSKWPYVGLVAGATDIEALRTVRSNAPEAWILCPGVGAQGGEPSKVLPVGLRKDGSGLLVSVSRAISKATDMGAAAVQLRDEINKLRSDFLAKNAAAGSSSDGVDDLAPYQKEFIDFAVSKNVLQFGSFKLKSGRISPYFFNAGLFNCGMSMLALSRFYAIAIKEAGIEFDVIFGPAYKGIPLATTVAVAWAQLYGENKDICYNRKEVKDHGEGGQLVGASMKGRKVLVVDDVITAGTAIRESMDILRAAEAQLAAVAVSLDRQEKTSETATESAIQQVARECGVPVLSIVRLKNLVAYVKKSAAAEVEVGAAGADATGAEAGSGPNLLTRIEQYRAQYGVEY